MPSRPRPLALSLAEKIKKDYVAQLPAGTRLPADDNLAKTYKVNRRTIRAALTELEDQGIVARKPYRGAVVAQAFQGDWYPFIGKCIGISFRQRLWMNDSASSLVVQGLFNALYPTGIRLAFTTRVWRSMCDDHHPASHFGSPDTIGLFHVGRWPDKVMESFRSLKLPSIAIDFDGSADEMDSVCFDNFGAGAKLTRQILKLDHKRIALVVEAQDKPADQRDGAWDLRRDGILAELKKADLQPFTEIPMSNRGVIDDVLPAIKALLKLPKSKRPTALILPMDFTEAIRALAKERKLKIPRDLTVVSFEDKNNASKLTSMQFDSTELGFQAGRQMMRKITDPKWNQRELVCTKLKGEYKANKTHARA